MSIAVTDEVKISESDCHLPIMENQHDRINDNDGNSEKNKTIDDDERGDNDGDKNNDDDNDDDDNDDGCSATMLCETVISPPPTPPVVLSASPPPIHSMSSSSSPSPALPPFQPSSSSLTTVAANQNDTDEFSNDINILDISNKMTNGKDDKPKKSASATKVHRRVLLRFYRHEPYVKIPKRRSSYSAGLDLASAHSYVVPARGSATIDTGLSVKLPKNCYGRIAPRSKLAANSSIDVGAGVIDSDYRGRISVILFNHSCEPFAVRTGDRIAQLICEKIEYPKLVEVEEFQKLDSIKDK